MKGWIKLHRQIMNNEIWNDITTFRLFILLLLRAAYKDGVKIKGIELKRGQYLRSYSKLAEDLEYVQGRGYKKVSKSVIQRSVHKLLTLGMVSITETDSGTIFTIIKYDEYQGLEVNSKNTQRTDNDPNAERVLNVNGTNTELEQELKNERIKEIEDKVHPLFEQDMKKLINFFEQNGFGMIGSHVTDQIVTWLERVPADLILEAMKVGVEYGGKTWAYVNKILDNWSKQGFKTVEQVRISKNLCRIPREKRAIRREKLPDWFVEHEKQSKRHGLPLKSDREDLEARKKRLKAIQRKYKAGGC